MAMRGDIFRTNTHDLALIAGAKMALRASAIDRNAFVSLWRYGTGAIPFSRNASLA
jgi:hypothetical protein